MNVQCFHGERRRTGRGFAIVAAVLAFAVDYRCVECESAAPPIETLRERHAASSSTQLFAALTEHCL